MSDETSQRESPSSSADDNAFNRGSQRQKKRLALLHEAMRLINSGGVASLSLEEVAANLSISKATVYYYFKSKQELLFECYDMSFDVWDAALQQAEAQPVTACEKLETFIRLYLSQGLESLQPMIHLREQNVLEPKYRNKVDARRRSLRNRMRAIIAAGTEDGSLNPVDSKIAATVIGASITWLLRAFRSEGDIGKDEYIALAIDILLGGLRGSRSESG